MSIKLAFNIFWRDFKRGRFYLFLAALSITIALVTSLSFFQTRIEAGAHTYFQTQLSADLLITSNQSIQKKWQDKARILGLKQSHALQFYSSIFANEQLALVDVLAVDDQYPLKGQIIVSNNTADESKDVKYGPELGKIWLDEAALSKLGIKSQDKITMGAAALTANHHLIEAPNPRNRWVNLSPRALMNLDDISRTQVIQPGSRLQYQLYLTGNEKVLSEFVRYVTPQLVSGQRLLDSNQTLPGLNTTADKAFNYLNLVAMLSLIIAGISIALIGQQYANAQLKYSALLQSFGMTAWQVIRIFMSIFIFLAIIAAVIGGLLGWVAQFALALLLEAILPFALPSVELWPLLHGLLYAIILTAGFALPYFLSLRQVPVKALLGRLEIHYRYKTAWVFMTAIALVTALMYWQIKRLYFTTLFIVCGLLIIIGLWYLVQILLLTLRKHISRFPFSIKHALLMLIGYKRISILQIICSSLILTVVFTLTITRNDLFRTWYQQAPDNAHNYFLINILDSDTTGIKQLFDSEQIDYADFYPIIRGRLTKKNDRSFFHANAGPEKNDPSLHRDLNLSESKALPKDNKILSGSWWNSSTSKLPGISVEANLAERLGIALNDKLTFQIANETQSGIVESLRSVQWDNFQPNFYFLFPEGTLKDYPFTYLTSFYLPNNNHVLLKQIAEQYPSVTIINITDMVQQFITFTQYMSRAIDFVLFFTIIMGILMLLAIEQVNWKKYRAILNKYALLGSEPSQIRSIMMAQSFIIGLVSGISATVLINLTAWLLANFLLSVPYQFNLLLNCIAPLTCILLFLGLGQLRLHRRSQ